MNLSIGIVGLPNVGKSTLFNALLKKQQAFVANYPFATIEPNIGVVPVPDERLLKLAEITKQEEKMDELPPLKPATVNFVDIAGLVKGASEGAGLGNKFLSHIREVSVVAHVVRAFEDENILKEGAVDPKSDYETIRTELMLSDLETVKKLIDFQAKQRKSSKDISDTEKLDLLLIIEGELEKGKSTSWIDLKGNEKLSHWFQTLPLVSIKSEIIVLNVSESDYSQEAIEKITDVYAGLLGVEKHKIIVICAKIEAELASLTSDEQIEYLRDLGLEKSGLERLIQKAYEELGLISYLTCGEKEVKAWTIKKGSSAVLAAGEIHTDFMKKFIKAEVVHYQDFVGNSGWKGAREAGKALLEGKDYIMQDGDVVEFKIGT